MKYVIWGLIIFGLYSGYKFLPVLMTRSSISHAVQAEMAGVTDDMTDDMIVKRLVRSAKVASIELDPARITVWRERRQGERQIRVDIEHPVAIQYLGSERHVMSHITVDEVVPVDEVAEARRLARKQRDQDRIERIHAANAVRRDKLNAALAECERETGGACEITGGPGPMGSYGMDSDSEDVDIIKAY